MDPTYVSSNACLRDSYDSCSPWSLIIIRLLLSWALTGRVVGSKCEVWNLNPTP